MENNNPLVSVIMCVYKTNYSFLRDSIESVLSQSYSNFEFFIIDDGSPDLCGEICDSYSKKDDRVIVIHQDNKGPSYSRNVGLKMAKGKYIAIIDSDDIALPSRFEKQVSYLEDNEDVVVLGTWYKHIGNKTNEVKIVVPDNEKYRCCLFFNNVPTILNPSVMIRNLVLMENNIAFDQDLRMGEDYLLWVRLSEKGKITNYPEVLTYYRIHDNQSTNRKNRIKIDKNINLINRYQLNSIGIELSDEIIDLYFCNYPAKINNIKKVFKALELVETKNFESKYYDIKSFGSVIQDYKFNCLSRLRNPFKILVLLFSPYTSKLMFSALWCKIKRFFSKHQVSRV